MEEEIGQKKWKRGIESWRKKGEGESSMRVEKGGLCRRDMCYLWVQRSLFAGQGAIDSLSMSAPLFMAQHRGDNSKLIHYWIRINIQAANINSQPKRGKCRICQNALTNKEQKAQDPWPEIPSFWSALFWLGAYSLVSAFCLISVLIFIMIFYRRARAGGSWGAACCFWPFSSVSSGFKICIWIFMIENNRGYKNKSLQSLAVSYRGKQCLPLQRRPGDAGQ